VQKWSLYSHLLINSSFIIYLLVVIIKTLLFSFILPPILSLALLTITPESNVVSDQLENHRALFVVLFVNCVNVCYGLLESTVGYVQSCVAVLIDLIQEYWHIQMKRQPNGVGLRQIWMSNCLSLTIVHLSLLSASLKILLFWKLA